MSRAFFLVLNFWFWPTVNSLALLSTASSRRVFLAQATTFGLVAPANALQSKNEALCGTGFFTNIWQYKCTEIGDIEDEGDSKELSTFEESSINSLMSKFNFDATDDEGRTELIGKESSNNPGPESK